MKKAVIFTGLVDVDKNMVGTAVIYKKIADILLGQGYKVTMVVPNEPDIKEERIDLRVYDDDINKKVIDSSSLVVFGAYPPTDPLMYAYERGKVIMTYLWSIAPIGSLEFKDFSRRTDQADLHRFITASYNMSLLTSDKIFCRDEGAKKFVCGSLASLGRMDLGLYRRDKNFKDLIEEAPFGVEDEKPKAEHTVYRGKLGNIDEEDTILLWNGGVWNWNDGETLVAAMKKLGKERIKLVFQGFRHPGRGQKISEEARRTLAMAKRAGLKDKNIFFSDEWVAYKRRADFLLESDIGVVSSPDIPEASMFFKTRIYDHLWTELPTILNDHEAFADIIQDRGLGLVCRTGDADDWADKIKKLSHDSKLRNRIKRNIREYKKDVTWKKTLKPVREFAAKPRKSPDKRKKNDLIREGIELNNNIIKDYL